MTLNKSKFAWAAAQTMGIVYVVCAIFVALAPGFALKLFGWLIHLVNVDKFAGDVRMTLGGFVVGLIQILVYAYVGGLLFAWLHNRSMEPEKP